MNMNDCEKLMALLDSFDIGYQYVKEDEEYSVMFGRCYPVSCLAEGVELIKETPTQKDNYDGYCFWACFDFDKEGKFISYGLVE